MLKSRFMYHLKSGFVFHGNSIKSLPKVLIISKMFRFCLVKANFESSEVGRFYEQREVYCPVSVSSA